MNINLIKELTQECFVRNFKISYKIVLRNEKIFIQNRAQKYVTSVHSSGKKNNYINYKTTFFTFASYFSRNTKIKIGNNFIMYVLMI
jgi:hypothetical protein